MSSAYNVNDLAGDFADGWFSGDFHPDCHFATTVKAKSADSGALKFTWVRFPSFIIYQTIPEQILHKILNISPIFPHFSNFSTFFQYLTTH